MPGLTTFAGRSRWSSWAALIGLALVLRPVFTSNSAVLLRGGAMDAAAPFLTALPVLAMASASAFAGGWLLRRGTRAVILCGCAILVLGTGARIGGEMLFLIAGSCAAAGAVGVLNVALPLLARTLFPSRLALATAVYSAALCGGAAAGATLTAAIVDGGMAGGEAAALWSLPAFAAFLVCAASLPKSGRPGLEPPVPSFRPAWIAGAIFMGSQGALAYCVFGWLTPMLQRRGIALAEAGGLAGLSMMAQIPGCLVATFVGRRTALRTVMPVAAPLVAGSALVGLQIAPSSLLLPLALVQGLAQGSLIALAMLFIAARPLSDGEMARVSARVQGCGYVLAAAGPQILGLLLARQSPLAMPFLLALSFAAAGAALFAQRNLSFGAARPFGAKPLQALRPIGGGGSGSNDIDG